MASSPNTDRTVVDQALNVRRIGQAKLPATPREVATATAVASIPSFHGLPTELLRALSVTARTRHYRTGSMITLAGDDEAGLIAILEGSVAIELDSAPEDAGPADLYTAPSAVLTGAGLIEGLSRMSLTAKSDTTVVPWTTGSLLPLMGRHPELIMLLLDISASMTLRAMTSAADNQLQSSERRCAAALYRLSLNGRKLPLTHLDLGQMTRVSRALIGSSLNAFADSGIVKLSYGCIEVRDRSSLALIREGTLSCLHTQ